MEFDQSNERYMALITAATQLSPLTAFYHQKHFNGKSPFRMAKHKLDKNPHVAVRSNQEVWFALNLNRDDNTVIHSINHEVTHLDQVFEEQKQKIVTTDNCGVSLLSSFIIESHAYSNQIEGPVLGLLENIKENNIHPLTFLERLRGKAAPKATQHTKLIENDVHSQPFIQTLFQDKSGRFRSNDLHGYIINAYRHDYRYLSETQKAGRVNEARKAVAASFLGNSRMKEHYIGNVIKMFTDKENKVIETLPIKSALCYRETSLAMLGSVCMNFDKPFLSEKDWYSVMGTADKKEFIKGVVSSSARKDELTNILVKRCEHLILS